MSIDITPSTDADTEVSVGDDFDIEATFDQQVSTADLTLTIDPSGSDTITKTGGDLSETDNGDGTYTYSYTHELQSRWTSGSWDLDSSSKGNAHQSFTITAQN